MEKRLIDLKNTLLGAVIGIMAAFPAQAATAAIPPSSVVLLWAPWCAPCRAEIADFVRLATASRPRDTVVLATENNHRSRAMLAPVPAAKLLFTTEPLPALFERLALSGPVALPLAVLTDAQGKICATIRGGANVTKIEQATRECSMRRVRP